VHACIIVLVAFYLNLLHSAFLCIREILSRGQIKNPKFENKIIWEVVLDSLSLEVSKIVIINRSTSTFGFQCVDKNTKDDWRFVFHIWFTVETDWIFQEIITSFYASRRLWLRLHNKTIPLKKNTGTYTPVELPTVPLTTSLAVPCTGCALPWVVGSYYFH
jgi:hypothetical protein